MNTVLVLNWTDTNERERHLRIDGRICGKIQRPYTNGKRATSWECQINVPRLRFVGRRVDEGTAKALVEYAAIRFKREREKGRIV